MAYSRQSGKCILKWNGDKKLWLNTSTICPWLKSSLLLYLRAASNRAFFAVPVEDFLRNYSGLISVK